MAKKYVYLFREGRADMKSLLGGKGANLCEMTNIGLPVPPGIIITTEACNEFYDYDRKFPPGMEDQVKEKLAVLEQDTGKEFGDPKNPLLLSVRSGAVISMPGMMDTVLNLGLNDETAAELAKSTNDERFALDCYRRFINMFGGVVMGIEHHKFEHILDEQKKKKEVAFDHLLTAEDWREVIAGYKKIYQEETGSSFPQDPMEQLFKAVYAVFNSWNGARAVVYRKINKIPDTLGTAVNIQMMAFGNLGNDCATGVAFTRNPSTGENTLYGEYLINAQGEDVVAGIRTPMPISKLKDEMPEVYQQFADTCLLLEKHYQNMQDVEFTIERGKLFMLQTRNGKRTAQAAMKIAVDMVKEGLISKEEGILRVEPAHLDNLLHRRIDPSAKLDVVAKGLPASPGAASGKVVFSADEAEKLGKEGEKVILVRTETTPDDIHGIVAAQGILTSRGGMTSHAAVVARGMGKPCVCGCESLAIDYTAQEFKVKNTGIIIKKGDLISIDGAAGQVMKGEVPMIDPEITGEFQEILDWADQIRTIGVRANADNPTDSARAREFGAEGIGLCRTEHMFFEGNRIDAVREMIVADDLAGRVKALKKLLPMQKKDFTGIFKVMHGLPVTIRTLDPPLHEFLPHTKKEMKDLAKKMGITYDKVLSKVESLHEANPMLGHRGCRLGIVYPEITEMQARAIFEAACEVKKKGIVVKPEVMIPLVGTITELALQKAVVEKAAKEVLAKHKVSIDYKIGTMIEIPRAAITADEIAQEAEFFSFGTNDLTQTALGMSRDDAGKFLRYYVEHEIYSYDPFQRIDEGGVGKLMQIGVELGRKTRKNLKIGICGEHGGEPNSVEFCHRIGLDYVSCSPYRVTVAKLAAARAAVKDRRAKKIK